MKLYVDTNGKQVTFDGQLIVTQQVREPDWDALIDGVAARRRIVSTSSLSASRSSSRRLSARKRWSTS